MSTRQGRPSLIIPKGSVKARGMVHEMVADTAKGIAEAIWEKSCTESDAFHRKWPSVDEFRHRRWHTFIRVAKEQLAEMLGMPDSVVTPDQKELIHDALLKNAAINPAENHVDNLLKIN